ncbi:kinase-like protein [Ceratobasidium sp. AG-I]|nr:kinase-like protein [Ceratobasidium sp. AG-I]
MSGGLGSDSDFEHLANAAHTDATMASISVEQVETPPMEKIIQLLDMTHVPPSTVPSHFLTLAITLMHNFHLCIADTSIPPVVSVYELLEVEFDWFCKAAGHIDVFALTAEEQRVAGNWYFHRELIFYPNNSIKPLPIRKTSRFSVGDFQGVGLTFGVPLAATVPSLSTATSSEGTLRQTSYGEIRLHALRNTSTQVTSVGASTVVNEILRASGAPNLPYLIDTLWGGDTCALRGEGPSRMFLRSVPTSSLSASFASSNVGIDVTGTKVYTSPRVGLNLSGVLRPSDAVAFNPHIQYLIRPYRFFRLPHLLGPPKPQTIYGLLTSGLSHSGIASLMHVSLGYVEKVVEYLEEGRQAGKEALKILTGKEGRKSARTMQGCMNILGLAESMLREGEAWQTTHELEGGTRGQVVAEIVPSEMSAIKVFECLLRHGCIDISSDLDHTKHSSIAVAGGSFGDIWQGKLVSGEKVAIKCLRFTTIVEDQPKSLKRLMRETYMWSKAKHENIQQLLGITMLQGRLGMVSLWRENGNLQDYIRKKPDVDRYQLCAQTTSGVSYLHSIKMVHGDIKAINILVSADGVVKLSDFDHSILSNCTLAFSATTNMGGGTLRWMAPELLLRTDQQSNQEMLRTTQTDIYALGMTMLEIITGKVPYAEYLQDFAIFSALVKKQPPERPGVLNKQTTQAEEMWKLLLQCWDHTPSGRPSAPAVLEKARTLSVKLLPSAT